ncbi:tRNA lysidine(34) synthetase TilS [Schaalia turicensis]|uniref:tRNA lysidine(34) synthetase TilS n=1 Tax=Schaalia turicensis TaxID=131111 RepID=UPI0013FDCFB4|nr:tRNA lysidine(34) synthetase TilS [Schaalia turicensis]
MAETPSLSSRIGPNPGGGLGRVSRAVWACLKEFQPGSAVVIGLSGGADSLALTLCALDCASRLGLDIVTVTVDHGVRAESADEARAVGDLARSYGADSHVMRVALADKGGPEGAGREARREVLTRVARSYDAPILLGHTLDDQAETVLLRLGRGSGAHSLRAMRQDATDREGIRWIRPLLHLRRADTIATCQALAVGFVDDPTNYPDGPWKTADGSPLRRSALRHRAIPLLGEALGSDPALALARTATLVARDDDALNQWADREWARVKVTLERPVSLSPIDEATHTYPATDTQTVALSVEPLKSLPQAVRTRIIRRFLIECGADESKLSMTHIDRVDNLVVNWHGQKEIEVPSLAIFRLKDKENGASLVPFLRTR